MLKTLFIVIASVFFFVLFTNSAMAHPGRTAADGCHYCRTNCAKWGEVEGARHCHGGGSVQGVESDPVYTAPAPTKPPAASLTPKFKPSPTPIVACSDVADFVCPKTCTAGNDSDCCAKVSGYQWYDNWGCYPKVLECSGTANGSCPYYCSAGNDADCCTERLGSDGYQWYENWGCYKK